MGGNEDLLELPGVPPSARPLWRRLVEEDRIPVYQLINEVTVYRAAIEAHDEGPSDHLLAKELARVSIDLLSTVQHDTSDRDRRLIQAAVRYFVLEDDGDGDLDSVLGFDDDAEVMNAVLVYLGRAAWQLEIP